jgi:antitoxin MazE
LRSSLSIWVEKGNDTNTFGVFSNHRFDAGPDGVYIQCRYMAATTTQIARWGNSLGLRLPKAVAIEAEVGEGDTVAVSVKNGTIVIQPSRPTYRLEELVAKITPRNRHDEQDWGDPVGQETW